MTVFAPVYCCSDRIPDCYSGKEADCVTFHGLCILDL